jgi:hypothetical protein
VPAIAAVRPGSRFQPMAVKKVTQTKLVKLRN